MLSSQGACGTARPRGRRGAEHPARPGGSPRRGQPNVSRHATALRQAGLLSDRREGTRTLVRVPVEAARDAVVADALASGKALCERDPRPAACIEQGAPRARGGGARVLRAPAREGEGRRGRGWARTWPLLAITNAASHSTPAPARAACSTCWRRCTAASSRWTARGRSPRRRRCRPQLRQRHARRGSSTRRAPPRSGRPGPTPGLRVSRAPSRPAAGEGGHPARLLLRPEAARSSSSTTHHDGGRCATSGRLARLRAGGASTLRARSGPRGRPRDEDPRAALRRRSDAPAWRVMTQLETGKPPRAWSWLTTSGEKTSLSRPGNAKSRLPSKMPGLMALRKVRREQALKGARVAGCLT